MVTDARDVETDLRIRRIHQAPHAHADTRQIGEDRRRMEAGCGERWDHRRGHGVSPVVHTTPRFVGRSSWWGEPPTAGVGRIRASAAPTNWTQRARHGEPALAATHWNRDDRRPDRLRSRASPVGRATTVPIATALTDLRTPGACRAGASTRRGSAVQRAVPPSPSPRSGAGGSRR